MVSVVTHLVYNSVCKLNTLFNREQLMITVLILLPSKMSGRVQTLGLFRAIITKVISLSFRELLLLTFRPSDRNCVMFITSQILEAVL
jgi:hypothetical protein